MGREAHNSVGTSLEIWLSVKVRVGTIFKKKNSLGNLLSYLYFTRPM